MASENSSEVSCNSHMQWNSAPPTCKCGVRSSLTTSWSPNNPGRRFYGCGAYVSLQNFISYSIGKFLWEVVMFMNVGGDCI